MYTVMLQDLPKKLGYHNINLYRVRDEHRNDIYRLTPVEIPDDISLYFLFSTTCLDHGKARKYIIGGYKVKVFLLQEMHLPLELEDLLGPLRTLIESSVGSGRSNSGGRTKIDLHPVIFNEDIITLAFFMDTRGEIMVSVGDFETGFFGSYFADNVLYTIYRKTVRERVMEILGGGSIRKRDYYRVLISSKLGIIPKYSYDWKKGVVEPNTSYGILYHDPRIKEEVEKAGSKDLPIGYGIIDELKEQLKSFLNRE